jgi:hypothetical protein
VTPDPQVRGARQNAFCEGQDALYVEFFELAGVTLDPNERELLAQFLHVAVVRLDVDRAFERNASARRSSLSCVTTVAPIALANTIRAGAAAAMCRCC